MAHLYADEDFALQAVQVLRRLGHDVVTAFEAGQANQGIPDLEILAFATAAQRVFVSFNRKDFVQLH